MYLTYLDFDEKTGTSKEDMILEELISTNLMQCWVGNVNAQKMCGCINELKRIYIFFNRFYLKYWGIEILC
ncbi:hypothetical protein [Clostridium hydrogenum]|uniref:hypothetical protein n=1 Tax=Clostridium hydrogenum TaxID=2855764 RepID=UPI001F2E69F7|nr:hypothetical protein [Clostridium hydrogenum]